MEEPEDPSQVWADASADVVAGLAAALEAVGRVTAAPTSTLSGEQHRAAVVDVYRLVAAAQAAALHLVRGLDERPEVVPGAPRERTAQWFLTDRVRLTRGQAAAEVAAAWALDPDGSGFVLGRSPVEKAAGVDPRIGPRTVAGTPVGPLPMLGQALANGLVHRAHVEVAVKSLRRAPGPALTVRVPGDDGVEVGAVDQLLSKISLEQSSQNLDRVAAQLLEGLGVNPKDRDPGDEHERRGVWWSTDRAGMVHVRAQLPGAEGLWFKAAIESFTSQPFTSQPFTSQPFTSQAFTSQPFTSQAFTSQPSPAAAAGVDGADAPQEPPFPDRRTLAQRRADALLAWVHATLHASGCACGDASASSVVRAAATVKVHVVVTAAQLDAATRAHPVAVDADGCVLGPPAAAPPGPRGRAADQAGAAQDSAAVTAAGYGVDGWGDPLGHGVLARLLCDADLQAITVSEGRRVLDLGRTVRLATARQRAALVARDRGCVMPGCNAPLARCEAHHVTWWRHGGTTDLDNLALCCPAHHAALHTGAWVLQMRDGVPYVIPPRWVDPTQTPRRNTLPDTEQAARELGARLRLDGMS